MPVGAVEGFLPVCSLVQAGCVCVVLDEKVVIRMVGAERASRKGGRRELLCPE